MFCEGQKEYSQISKVKVYMFHYAEPFARHHLYIGYVDNHSAIHHDGQKNIRLVWIMYGLSTGVQSDYLHFYIMHRGIFLFLF